MHFSFLVGIIGWRNSGIGYLGAQQGIELECLQVQKLCNVHTHTMGLSASSLHIESTKSLIHITLEYNVYFWTNHTMFS